MLTPAATTRLARELTEIPELIVRTHLALQPAAGRRGARVSGATRTAPLPCRLDVLSTIGPTAAAVHDGHHDQAATPSVGILAGWAEVVLDDRRRANDWSAWVRPASGATERTASVAIKVLLLHLDFAAQRDYARDLANEVTDLHRHLARVTGWTPAPPRPVRIVCPLCDLLTVGERTDGIRQCTNPACQHELTIEQYQVLAEQRLTRAA
ncbi:hypothetical protein ACFWOG_04440 [Kitasatospora sp. NPDC058406]|uniref:hypothetical protein n=1 Tax=Kitasatospora sp. NPDC058406 TaxID=3346483 RepID=UPI00365A59EA